MNPTINQVTLTVKANIYFDGKVVSHGFIDAAGTKKTLGLIYPGTYLFNTQAPERMTVTHGSCQVLQKGESQWQGYETGQSFEVPAHSAFEIKVEKGLMEYLCEFL